MMNVFHKTLNFNIYILLLLLKLDSDHCMLLFCMGNRDISCIFQIKSSGFGLGSPWWQDVQFGENYSSKQDFNNKHSLTESFDKPNCFQQQVHQSIIEIVDMQNKYCVH